MTILSLKIKFYGLHCLGIPRHPEGEPVDKLHKAEQAEAEAKTY